MTYLKKLAYRSLLLTVIVLTVLAIPHSSHSESPKTQPIRIGWIGPLTGSLAKFGSYQATQIAVEEINAAGGIVNRPLELIVQDGKGLGKEAVAAAQKLISEDHVQYILGGHVSPESLAIAPIVQRSNVVMLSSVTSSPLLTTAGDNIFRVTAVSTKGTEVVYRYATDQMGFKSFAVLYEEADYPRPQAERFRAMALESGTSVGVYEGFLPNETDFRTILSRIKSKKLDALYLASLSPDSAALLLRQFKELGLTIPIFGNESTGHAVDSSGQQKSVFENIIGSSRNRVGKMWCYPDVNVLVHVNVNVPERGVILGGGMVWKAWL